ncbi:HNH endonuclease [Blastopirellula sp. J2-11]|uniref:HNH endonuclease n=1 Tax=Blastopirellula sp. J2-11 TaxID=2943192 RepID=UPI0021C81778|nr:HNH endonuclease [Blastopirellula sp. J2-11]UUO05189.1 HNH endonuclease [Blastopirellula sp. J2-11]
MSAILERPTLVLNRNWQPVGVASVARSLTKVFSGTARIVDPLSYQLYDWEDWSQLVPNKDEPFISSQRLRIRVPEVVTLVNYDRVPRNTVTFSRRNVFKRDNYTCQYCGSRPGSESLTIDHVLPRAQGGESSWENCVLACVECNHSKANRTPLQARMPLHSIPVRPRWSPVYAARRVRIESWAKFISEAYWDTELGA